VRTLVLSLGLFFSLAAPALAQQPQVPAIETQTQTGTAPAQSPSPPIPENAQPDKPSGGDTEKEAKAREEARQIRDVAAQEDMARAAWRMVSLTLVQIVVGGITIGFLGWTVYETRRTAKAAIAAAEHVTRVERAYVKLSHTEQGVFFSVKHHGQLPPGTQAENEGVLSLEIQAKNWGETPARLTAIALGPIYIQGGKKLPATPPYPEPAIIGNFLVRGEESFIEFKFTVDKKTSADLLRGTVTLYMIGYVDYVDAFGGRHRSGYARIWTREAVKNLNVVTDAAYSYDRARLPGEGNDWN
jgi:hypothetical protein